MGTAFRVEARASHPGVDHRRSAVEEALLDAALDTIAPLVSEECRADRTCLASLVDAAVREAAEHALETLDTGLAAALDEAPPGLRHRLEILLVRSELGCE